jgi:hypothetical protein
MDIKPKYLLDMSTGKRELNSDEVTLVSKETCLRDAQSSVGEVRSENGWHGPYLVYMQRVLQPRLVGLACFRTRRTC